MVNIRKIYQKVKMHIFNNQLKMFRSQITRERGVDALIGLQLQATVRTGAHDRFLRFSYFICKVAV